MHVLVLPSWYPTKEQPHTGGYLAEQMQAVQAQRGVRYGVAFPESRSLRTLSWPALRANHFQRRWHVEEGLPVLRRHGWNVFSRLPCGLHARVREAVRLAERYAARCGRPDLVHAHSAQWAGAAAARFCAARGLPYVLTEHFSGFARQVVPLWQQKLAREGLRRAHGVAAVSTALRATLNRQGLLPASRVQILPNMVDAQFFRPPSAPPPAEPFRFVALGSLRPVRAFDVLLHAFARAYRGRGDVRLTLGGDGPERDRLKTLAAALGLDGQVRFPGALSRRGVRAALWQGHAFVLPSRIETFGLPLIEAMATGLPVVATRCGGPEDFVTPKTGLLVPPGDVAALAEALRALQKDHAAFDAVTTRRYIKDHFGAAPFARRTMHFYRAALAG